LSRKSSPEPVVVENKQEPVSYTSISPTKTSPRKKSSTKRAKSAKSVVFVHPDDQSIVVVENSFIKGEPIKPIIKRPKSQMKKTRFQVETLRVGKENDQFIIIIIIICLFIFKDDSSTKHLVQTPRSHRCLNCLSRCMCLIICICLILLLIGLAGAAVSAYFLATGKHLSLTAKKSQQQQ